MTQTVTPIVDIEATIAGVNHYSVVKDTHKNWSKATRVDVKYVGEASSKRKQCAYPAYNAVKVKQP